MLMLGLCFGVRNILFVIFTYSDISVLKLICAIHKIDDG